MDCLTVRMQAAVAEMVQESIADGGYRSYLGPYQTRLEEALGKLLAGSQVLLANGGTAALAIALKASGVERADEVIMAGYDYPGNFWVVEQLGCVPVLVDVEASSSCVSLERLEKALSVKTKACIVSHLHGQLQPIQSIRRWADQHGLVLIEDACQAIGANCDDRPIGTFGHFGILSFSGSKVISAGRGGALVTNDPRLFQRSKIAAGAGSGATGMSEVAAAMVLAQLPLLTEINQECRRFFAAADSAVNACNSLRFLEAKNPTTAFYQAGWLVPDAGDRDVILQHLAQHLLTAGRGFVGFHRRSTRRCRVVENLNNTADLVDRLVLVHHQIALSGTWEPQQLAAAMLQAMPM
jgi:perosamine synthetase